jgi:hypothetical protein
MSTNEVNKCILLILTLFTTLTSCRKTDVPPPPNRVVINPIKQPDSITIYGQIKDSLTGEPLEGIEFRVYRTGAMTVDPFGGLDTGFSYRTESNKSGYYYLKFPSQNNGKIDVVPSERYRNLFVRKDSLYFYYPLSHSTIRSESENYAFRRELYFYITPTDTGILNYNYNLVPYSYLTFELTNLGLEDLDYIDIRLNNQSVFYCKDSSLHALSNTPFMGNATIYNRLTKAVYNKISFKLKGEQFNNDYMILYKRKSQSVTSMLSGSYSTGATPITYIKHVLN